MKVLWAFLLVGLGAGGVLSYAQEGRYLLQPNPTYDGRYAFVRIRYAVKNNDPCTAQPPQGAGWHHDYPLAERSLMELMNQVTRLDGRADSSLLLKLDDPELMKYPIAYLTEPACWNPSEAEASGLRMYLLKGGFLIVDDFTIGQANPASFVASIQVFEARMRRILPNGRLVKIDPSDPVFKGIFDLDPVGLFQPMTPGIYPDFYGIYEDNDPSKRLLVAANYNNDINKYWHMSGTGFKPVAVNNTAYQMGVNYLMYGFMY